MSDGYNGILGLSKKAREKKEVYVEGKSNVGIITVSTVVKIQENESKCGEFLPNVLDLVGIRLAIVCITYGLDGLLKVDKVSLILSMASSITNADERVLRIPEDYFDLEDIILYEAVTSFNIIVHILNITNCVSIFGSILRTVRVVVVLGISQDFIVDNIQEGRREGKASVEV